MSEIVAIIADADERSQEDIRSILKKNWPDIVVAGRASNGHQTLELIGKIQPEIAFVDVKMPGLSGVEVAQKVLNTCKVVFITEYDQYIVNAFKSEAIDYLLKPFSKKQIIKTIERIKIRMEENFIQSNLPLIYEKLQSNISGKETPVYIKWIKALIKESVKLIPVDQIHYIQSNNRHTLVHTEDMEIPVKKSISELIKELDPEKFLQISRSIIVNAVYIEKVSKSPTDRGLLKLKNRPEIYTISRKFSSAFKNI